MIFADDLSTFASEEKVRQYQRLQNGRLVTVNQHQRKGETNQAVDNSLINSIKTGANVPFNIAVAGLGLVGLAAGTRAFVVNRHQKQVRDAAIRVLTQAEPQDLRFLSKANPQKLPDDFSQYEGVIIATGGFAGTKGQHALSIHNYLKKDYPNHLILSVENIHNDLGWETDLVKRYSKVPSLLWRNATQGNKTSEELATVAKMVRSKTDKPLTFVTASGGGMAVKEAQEITDQLGLKDIQGIGLGTPTWSLAQPKSPYVSIMDKSDAGVGSIPFTSKKDTYFVSRGNQKVKWYRDPYQGEVEWGKQHEYGMYLSHPETRSKVDQIIYRNRQDKSPFQPQNYQVDFQQNVARNPYIQRQKITSQYSHLEQQAWANFDTLFCANFAAEQDVRVKSYIRNGKLVRSYTAKRDKALEDEGLVDKLRSDITGTIEKKGVGSDTAAKIAIGALAVGGIGVALVGGRFLVQGVDSGLRTVAKSNWDSNLPKRARMIEEMADDLVAGRTLFRGQTLKTAIGDADTVITVKGGINMGGKGGTLLKNEYLEKIRRPGDKWAVLDLDNKELDSTGLSSKNVVGQTLKDWWERFVINPYTKGYNEDSIEVAAYMRAVEKINPNANKVMLGYSAGGITTVAAASDLEKLRNVTKARAISFGVPYTGITQVNDPRIVDTVTFINKDDVLANSFLARGNKENINTIMMERPNKKIETDVLAGHGYKGYFARENWDRIRRVINNGSQEAFR
ncbi:MAG: hypothetical protein IM613_12860 [Cytophagales bacterium]|nr:hypothetical protein [Cytophagales bacterium]